MPDSEQSGVVSGESPGGRRGSGSGAAWTQRAADIKRDGSLGRTIEARGLSHASGLCAANRLLVARIWGCSVD